MGVIRPPWVSKEWFDKCPFNYCDHFGDQELLAAVCKICKEDLQRREFYKKAGKDPNDWKYVFKDLTDDLVKVHKMLDKEAKRLGIDLNNLDDIEEAPEPETYTIFNLVKRYGNQVEKIIKHLQTVPIDADLSLIIKVVYALSHSRHYIIAKTGRALSSRWEEEKDPEDDLNDSKTSALFVYVAIERNSRALLALSKHKSLRYLKEKLIKFADISLNMAQLIKEEFFPKDKLIYKELGSEECDKLFAR